MNAIRGVAVDELDALTVMIVDDDAFSRKFVSRTLTDIGIGQVIAETDGAAALSTLAREDLTIHLLITDIEMPEVNGYELVRRIRFGVVPRYKDLPVLMLTGRATQENLRKARIHRINGLLVKSPNTADIERGVRSALGR